MAQKRVQKYNPVTRKYEWVTVDAPVDNKRISPPKNPEHKQIVDWIKQFDSSVNKPTRTNEDYAFLIRRMNGVDVTPAVLNDAKSAGLIDDANYRKRLKQYQDTRAEIGKRPMTDDSGKPVMYQNQATGKSQPMLRSMWIKDGTYNYNRSFDDVAREQNEKRAKLISAQKNYKAPSETADTFSHLGQVTAGTSNRNTVPQAISGFQKGAANSLFNVVGAAENLLNKSGSSLFNWTGEGAKGGISPELYNQIRAGVVNSLYDPVSTDEEKAALIANTVAGDSGPRSQAQAVGMEAGNFAGNVGVGIGSTALATAAAPFLGVEVPVITGAMTLGQIGGGLAELFTGDARYNPLGNTSGAIARLGGKYNRSGEEALNVAHEKAYATGPLMLVAGLTTALLTKNVGAALNSGNYKDGLKAAVNGVKTLQASAAAAPEVGAISAGAKGMGLPVTPKAGIKDMATKYLASASPFAVEGVVNTAVPAVQGIASMVNPNIPAPTALDFATGAAFGVLSHAPKGTLPHAFNELSHNIARDATVKINTANQAKAARSELARNVPLYSHLMKTYNMSSDEALAYMSHEWESQHPGMQLPADMESKAAVLNTLPSAERLAANAEIQSGDYQMVVDPAIAARVREGQSLTRTQQEAFGVPVKESIGPEPYERAEQRPNKMVTLEQQINPGLKKFSKFNETLQTRLNLLQVQNELNKPPVTAKSAADQLETNKRQIPLASMIIETDEGPRKVMYSHDLTKVFVSEDLGMPTHELHPDTYEIGASHLPKENLGRGIAKFNEQSNSSIRWQVKEPTGAIANYSVVGFGNGRLIVRRAINDVATIHELTPREMELASPQVQERLDGLLNDLSSSFGTNRADHGDGAVNYTRTSFAKADRDLFPQKIFAGVSTRGNRGALPARKIATDAGFNTYQLPNGAVIRVQKSADTPDNIKAPVLPSIDTRMETVIGSRYAQDLLTQANAKEHPGYYDVTLENGGEKRIYVSPAIQKDIKKKILDPAKEEIFNAGSDGTAVKEIQNKANADLLRRLLFISRTGKQEGDVSNYNYGYTDTPVTVGDVVQFIHHEKDGKTRSSSVLNAGHERGVVVAVDKHGVHVKLANELPGLIEGEGGRSVIVHPDNLQPIIQPHLGSAETNMQRIGDVADLEAAFGYGKPKPVETVEEAAVAETVAMPPDPESEARLQGAQIARVTERLMEEGTVDHVRKTLIDVAQDRTISSEAMSEGVVNLLNGDSISYGHKEAIIHALLATDLDVVNDLNSIVKLNQTLDGVGQWLLSENRPINLAQDISTMFSGDVVDTMMAGRAVHEHAGIILNQWNKNTVKLSTVIERYFRSEAGSKLSPEEREVITKRVIAMSHVIPQLRTYLNGRRLNNAEAWSRVARLSIEDQRKLYDVSMDMFRKGRDTDKNTSALGKSDIDNLLDLAGVSPTMRQLPRAKNVKYESYQSMVKNEINAYKQELNSKGTTVAVAELQKPNGSGNISDVNAFLKRLNTEDTTELRRSVIDALAEQDISESDFTALFSGLRFPGTTITVGEVVNNVKNNTLPQYVEAQNQLRSASMQLSNLEGIDLQQLQDIFLPFSGRVPDDVQVQIDAYAEAAFDALSSPRNAGAPLSQRQAAFADNLNNAIALALRHISPDPELVQESLAAAKKSYNAISNKTLKALELQTKAAEAQQATAGMTGPVIKINQDVTTAIKSTVFDLNTDNASEPPPTSRMSQDEFDSIRATHEEANQWIKDQKVPTVTNVTVDLPFVDVTNTGAVNTETGRPVQLSGETANVRDALVTAFKNSMGMGNMKADVEVIVNQLAEAYADAYDLHAYSYATRHAEYEFQNGRVDECNTQVLQILEASKRLATNDIRRAGIESLIKRVEAGESLFTSKDKSYVNEIVNAFPKEEQVFGEKLSAYIFTSRIAKLQSEFYKNNGRLVLTAADPAKVQGPMFMSFASLTADGVTKTGERAAVNLLLHLNRTSNRSRDVLSIGHELHHGLYHTMPLMKKLEYARDVLGAIMKAHGMKESDSSAVFGKSPDAITDIASVYKLVTQELATLESTRKNLETLAREKPTAENLNRLELFDYENSVDMHGNTNHWIYKNTLLNEAVVSSLITGSMGMKPIYDSANFTVAYTASGVFNRVGALINRSVQLMTRGNKPATDWAVKSSSGLIDVAQHRWKVKYKDHFVAYNKDGKAIAFARLPENATLSFVTTGNKSFPSFPTFEATGKNNVLVPTQAATPRSAETLPPAVVKIGGEGSALSVYGNYVTFKKDSKVLGKLTNVEPSFTLDGNKYYKLDTVDGIAQDSINGVKISRGSVSGDAYGLVNPETRSNKSITIIKPEQLLDMTNVRLSGNSEGWNPALSSLMYSMYGKTNALASAATGRMDWATHGQMRKRVIQANLDIDKMPTKNVSSFAVGQNEYATTVEGQAANQSSLFALNTMRREANRTREVINEYIENLDVDAGNELADNLHTAIEGLRRSMFALDEYDFPLTASVIDNDGSIGRQYVPSILTSENGNTRAMPGMFHVTKDEVSSAPMQVVQQAARELNGMLTPEQFDAFTNILLDSHSLKSFQEAMFNTEKYGLDPDAASDVLGVIADSIQRVKEAELAAKRPELSPDDVMHNFRSLALGATDSLGRTVKASSMQTMFDRLSSTDSDMTPNVHSQREFVLTAANAAAEASGKHVADFLMQVHKQPAGQEAAVLLTTANAMAIDVANRSSAMRSYNQWEIAGTQYFGNRKSPYLILRNKGAEGQYTQELNEGGKSRTLYIAIDQHDSSVRPAVPIYGENGAQEFIIVKGTARKEAGYGGVIRYDRHPETPPKNINQVNWLMSKEGSDGYKVKTAETIEITGWDGTSPLQQSLSNVNVQTHKVLSQVISTALTEIGNTKGSVKTYDVTLPFYVQTGIDAVGQFNPSSKPQSIIDVFNTLDSYARKEEMPDGNLQMRHMKVKVERTGDRFSVTFQDLGSMNATTNPRRRTLGQAATLVDRQSNGGIAIAPVEAYIARHLLAIESYKEANGQDSFFTKFEKEGKKTTSTSLVETPKDKLPISRLDVKEKKGEKPTVQPASSWKEWKGNSVFSDGYDPADFIDHVQSPANETEQSSIVDQAPGDVLVVHDTSLSPDAVAIDIDAGGVHQVRGGRNVQGWHTGLSKVRTAVNEVDGFFRTVKLAGDISVALNQSWLLANPLTAMEHFIWARKNNLSVGMQLGPQFTAMGGAGAMLPNTPGIFAAIFKNSPVKLSKWGDDYVHMYMEKVLSRTDLTLDQIENYGLNLEYLKWHKEYRERLSQDPNTRREDVPLNLRLSDYYGDSKYAQKIIPLVQMKERYNVLYKDLAALTEFQKRYIETQGMFPKEKVLDSSITHYRDTQLRDSATAINILQGMQKGETSPSKGLGFLQKLVSKMVTSAKYRHSRLMLTPIVGRGLYQGKLLANKVSNAVLKRDIASTTYETKLFADQSEGGFTPEVKRYIRNRLWMGYGSARAIQLASRASILVEAFRYLLDASEDKRKEGAQILLDELINSGMMKLNLFGHEYEMPMPGGLASGIRQYSKYTQQSANAIANFGEWSWRQYVVNQMGPTFQALNMARTGKTFSGQNAWETNAEYVAWRDAYIANNAKDPISRAYLETRYPRNLSRFMTELGNVSFTDHLKDVQLKRQGKFARGEDIDIKPEDVQVDYIKDILNQFGAGATNTDPELDEWLKENVEGSTKRWQMIDEMKKAGPRQSIAEQYGQSGLKGVVFGNEGKDVGY